MLKIIAIQGAKGSFHEIATKKFFGSGEVDILYCQTFLDVFKALESGSASSAFVAIGNNRYGDIDHVYDILIANRLSSNTTKYWISGEVYINIEHHLIGLKGARVEDIKEVHSQAPAIVQCFSFIHRDLNKAVAIEEDDTALSAKYVAEWDDKTKAAIASKEAAKIYGLSVLADNIQDDENNITRFLLVEPNEDTRIDNASKTSLLLRTSHTPGALSEALNLFTKNDINLSYLQSVPIANRPFEYRFYIDIDGGIENKAVDMALSGLRKLGYQYDILGSYKRATVPKIRP
ncbi:MAG TPA: prephenate dehydratase domain-containing protein [Candidatus Saccharimonadales bacterium]